jgi:hypothetical protein
MCEDLRNLLLAIEGPALDEHPYEPCSVPGHQAFSQKAPSQKALSLKAPSQRPRRKKAATGSASEEPSEARARRKTTGHPKH